MTNILDKIFHRAEQNALDYKHGSIDAYRDCISIVEAIVESCREDAATSTSTLELAQLNAHITVLSAVARNIRAHAAEVARVISSSLDK